MKTCIICRIEKDESEFNDEHVIPDSIKGYYHIKSVCIPCNSKLGATIDNKLTNHQFITFQRHTLGIKGKSSRVPNPFAGTHTLKEDPNQKLRLELDSDGIFEINLLPKVPTTLTNDFNIIIDKKDEGKLEEIVDKFLRRNGISKDKVKTKKTYSKRDRPEVQVSMKIDIKDFKMAILKIAYEFGVDSIPEYFNDPDAMVISQVLESADFDGLYDKVTFFGDGFNREILKPFEHLIDFANDNHYLVLIGIPGLGLVCIVNLFNVFNLGIRLTNKSGYAPESIIVGKNDINKRNFEILDMTQIVSIAYSPIEYRFQYLLPKEESLISEFKENEKQLDFGFYTENGTTPFFNSKGKIAYTNIDDKLEQPQLVHIPLGDTTNHMITQINLDEELYIKILPVNKFYRVLSVSIEQHRIGKI